MKYYVRTTGERDLSAYNFLNYTALYDYEHQPVKSFIKQMKLISEDDALFMEDDIIFCEDFQHQINEAIKRYPNQIINFFYQPLTYLLSGKVPGKKFLYNQCVYYPKGISARIAEEMQKLVNEGIKWTQYDEIQGEAMKNLGIDFISYRPCLVQHVGAKSLLGNKWINGAQTIFFIDDLENLALDYDDAKEILSYTYKKMREIDPNYVKPKIIKRK